MVLTSRQVHEKLQCFYENLMLNEKIWGRHMQVHALETLFKIFYTFACKNFLGKIADK